MTAGPGLPAGLLSWLRRVLPGQRVTRAERLSGGYSGDTIRICTTAGREYVLRRYVRANTCAVEAALAARLAGVVPVPRVVAADPSGTEAGEPVLLSEFVAGVQLSHAIAAGSRCDAAGLGHAVGAVLAGIGSVRFAGSGLLHGADLVPSQAGMPSSLPEFVDACLADGASSRCLNPAEQDGLRSLARQAEPLLAAVAGASQLVHSDYNGKNLLVTRGDGRWSVTAVLDWEFAYSGSPLADIGNMLRFRDEIPAGFGAAFIAGYQAAGAELPAGWRPISEALDLFALADFLTRPPEHEFVAKAVAVIRDRLARA